MLKYKLKLKDVKLEDFRVYLFALFKGILHPCQRRGEGHRAAGWRTGWLLREGLNGLRTADGS